MPQIVIVRVGHACGVLGGVEIEVPGGQNINKLCIDVTFSVSVSRLKMKQLRIQEKGGSLLPMVPRAQLC